jgi:uncharacterized protein
MLLKISAQIENRLGISINQLTKICQKWGIIEMSLFGSILRNDFHSNSDIDFLISFASNVRQGLLTLARIKNELESLLNRSVDLTIKESIENSDNWIRRHEILTTAQIIYEQR